MLKITTSKTSAGNGHILGVLKVDSIGVGAVAGGRNSYSRNLYISAGVKLEVGLRAVLNCYASDSHAVASIEPKRLHRNIKLILGT